MIFAMAFISINAFHSHQFIFLDHGYSKCISSYFTHYFIRLVRMSCKNSCVYYHCNHNNHNDDKDRTWISKSHGKVNVSTCGMVVNWFKRSQFYNVNPAFWCVVDWCAVWLYGAYLRYVHTSLRDLRYYNYGKPV